MPAIGDVCTAKNDIVSSGAQVTVTDATGKVIGVGQMSNGSYQSDEYASFCRFTFTVSDLPDGSSFYGVKIGDAGQEPVQLTRAEAPEPTLTIGGSLHGDP